MLDFTYNLNSDVINYSSSKYKTVQKQKNTIEDQYIRHIKLT